MNACRLSNVFSTVFMIPIEAGVNKVLSYEKDVTNPGKVQSKLSCRTSWCKSTKA